MEKGGGEPNAIHQQRDLFPRSDWSAQLEGLNRLLTRGGTTIAVRPIKIQLGHAITARAGRYPRCFEDYHL
jgi:hypothetical protein